MLDILSATGISAKSFVISSYLSGGIMTKAELVKTLKEKISLTTLAKPKPPTTVSS
jgi:hypothetical protein